MKYVNASTMLLSLVAAFLLIQLGFGYETEGYGLHPALAGMGVLVVLGLGWKASCLLSDQEE